MSGTRPPPPQHRRLERRPTADGKRPERRFAGIAVSDGVAIGPVFTAAEPEPVITRHKIQAADIAAEGARLEAAVVQSRKQLNKLKSRLAALPEDTQEELEPLIDAYIRMLGPSRLMRGARRRIEETLVSAESAVIEEAEDIAATILGQIQGGKSAEDAASLRRRAEESARSPAGLSATSRAPRSAASPRCRKARSCWLKTCAPPTPRCWIPRGWPAWRPRKVGRTATPR